MIVVTGGAGFIGSNIVKALNLSGMANILVVDDLSQGNKVANLTDCDIIDFVDKDEFIQDIVKGGKYEDMDVIFHQGACSDTMELDGRYMMQTNYEYSKTLLETASKHSIPFIYASSASVYGDGKEFIEEVEYEKALNVYAYSKLLFDRYVRRHRNNLECQIVGLRYFNVYGPGETNKGRMASVAWHFYQQYQEQGYVNLFEGSGGYEAGEQLRDFVYIDDVVNVNMHFLSQPQISGIFNVGTGRAQSFNDVACAALNALSGEQRTTAQWVKDNMIRYIPFPEQLRGKYQSYTQADLDKLMVDGEYTESFADVDTGVSAYLDSLKG
ncbi:MAG: ADP-glyceromanno-heptose 6-epimerase [Arenicellaceae bacterium]|nr:ADP-glyceromanno-heptose 6-epimerase [Arenicellaceae bacterium]